MQSSAGTSLPTSQNWFGISRRSRITRCGVEEPHLKLVQQLVRLVKQVEGVDEDDLHGITMLSMAAMIRANGTDVQGWLY